MSVEQPALLAMTEKMVRASALMSPAEQADLSRWERENVTGDGRFTSSDWPGWRHVFARVEQ